jgi:hypothetical protein
MYVCMYVYIYVCMYVCIYIYMYIYIYVFIYMYTKDTSAPFCENICRMRCQIVNLFRKNFFYTMSLTYQNICLQAAVLPAPLADAVSGGPRE